MTLTALDTCHAEATAPVQRATSAATTVELPRALVFMTGRNCEQYVGAAIESLVWQTHRRLHVLFVDDCSSDGTARVACELLDQYFPGRHTLVVNQEPWGKARNAHVHLRAALHLADFVAVLDADDQLIAGDILAQLAHQYDAGFDVVWTNFETDVGGVGMNRPLDPFQPPRGQGWRTSHFFSFRAELFAHVPEDRFRDSGGQWLMAACDFAIAYPVLDQTRRYCFLPVRAYRYTTSNPTSHHNRDEQARGLSSRHQIRCAEEVLAKPPLPCRRWMFGSHAAADQAIAALRQRLQAPPPPATPALKLSSAASTSASWEQAAAATLAASCPAVLALAMDGQGESPSVAQAWQWWQWLQAGPARPRVLEIGGGVLAPQLHAMVLALGGQVISALGHRDRAVALYARLNATGIDAEVVHLPLVEAEFEACSGHFPDLSALPGDGSPFDIVVVDGGSAGRAPGDALLTLPMVAARLRPEAFRLCFWSPADAGLRQRAQALWSRAAPDLSFVDGAFGGSALCVHSS